MTSITLRLIRSLRWIDSCTFFFFFFNRAKSDITFCSCNVNCDQFRVMLIPLHKNWCRRRRSRWSSGAHGAKFPPLFSPGLFSLKDMHALGGGGGGGVGARRCASLEMYHTCLTKVICKQKRNPIENTLLCHGTTPCLCVPRACLITFKEHFQTAFREACQHSPPPPFSSGNFQNNLVLPSLFLWFERWIINVLPALPHQAQHTIPRTSLSSPPLLPSTPRGWSSTMRRQIINIKISFYMGVTLKEKKKDCG